MPVKDVYSELLDCTCDVYATVRITCVYLTNQPTNQPHNWPHLKSLPWISTSSGSENIRCILFYPSQVNPVYAHPSYFVKTHFIIILLFAPLATSDLFPVRFPQHNPVCISVLSSYMPHFLAKTLCNISEDLYFYTERVFNPLHNPQG